MIWWRGWVSLFFSRQIFFVVGLFDGEVGVYGGSLCEKFCFVVFWVYIKI